MKRHYENGHERDAQIKKLKKEAYLERLELARRQIALQSNERHYTEEIKRTPLSYLFK